MAERETLQVEKPADNAVAEDIWVKCPSCKEIAFRKEVERNLNVCGKCGHHYRLTLSQRLSITADRGSWHELFADIAIGDPLEFVDSKPYPGRLAAARKSAGRNDAVVVGTATVKEHPVALAIMDFEFMGGSMGVVVGEKIARVFDHALANSLPVVLFAASGGARMQEGALSLMQMARTTVAIQRLRKVRLPYVVVLTDATTGGVTASYAMLGDIQLAEPGAAIGFTGPRVIEQTIRQTLPPGFQTSEFQADHGMVDSVVQRREIPAVLASILRTLMAGRARLLAA